MNIKKDRCLHPRGFLASMLENWGPDREAHRLTAELLKHVDLSRMKDIKDFYEAQKDIGENLGSAFYSVLSFVAEYIVRYNGAPNHVGAILDVLQRSRAALSGAATADSLHVMNREVQGEPVAFLATIGRGEGDLVVPLVEGKNFIGRAVGSRPFGAWPKPYAVEQAQWFIDCRASNAQPTDACAQVWDASSTNESVLLPSASVHDAMIEVGTSGFGDLAEVPGAIVLPHPNKPSDQHTFDLNDGDVLRSYYASFVFSWL